MDRDVFRRILGRFATGVAVVTTAVEGSLHGITVNSLTSVSLDPLLVLVCIERRARAHAEIERARRFGVNFLRHDQEAISRLFAASSAPEEGRLRGVPFRIGRHGTPILEDRLAHLECDVSERFSGGDHSIFLGSVLGGDLAASARPLIYFQGRYRTLAD